MKMPGNQTTDNGLYDYEDNSYFSEGIENRVVEDFNATAETDFSEYLWMEHEEEFDKEVMQRLEEEALMEECLEAFMNDENNSNPATQQSIPASVDNVANSKLNPEAAEFVPSNRRTPQEVPTSTSS
ncbi:unnamed protein product [Phyllotreta striolata]|uniref:Polyadenylate-binding protein-interacting protein 2B n=1 Tax=Phyllotreta striolata TaxID=444603 RepID=A0A9P0DNL6_PHYSR|nr:unnamed protein product [Phyllotreta striolata]